MTATGITACQIGRSFGFGRSRIEAVKPLDLRIQPGDLISIVGESGSGKSTLARMLVGLESCNRGEVLFGDTPLAEIMRSRQALLAFRAAVQYVAQDTYSSFDPRLEIGDALATPLRSLCNISGREADRRISDLLTTLELDPELRARVPSELSGGQRQRFALARALIVEPRFLICDEVVSALDVSVQGAVLNMIKSYCKSRRVGLLFVTHGLPAAAFVTSRIVVMRNGAIVDDGQTTEIISSPKHPYTRSLVDAARFGDDGKAP